VSEARVTEPVEGGAGRVGIEFPPEPLSYRLKKLLLGPPLVSERVSSEKLGKPTALAVLSSDLISSVAYGPEAALVILVPAIGLGAFRVLPLVTLVLLAVLAFVTLSYFQILKAFPNVGGSYVVTREAFGHHVAQVATAALFVDYTLTVAISVASGIDALSSLVPALVPYHLVLAVAVVLILAYGNLRGVREAGRAFAIPTYFFMLSVGATVLAGIAKWVAGSLPVLPPHQPGAYDLGRAGQGLLAGASFFVLGQAYANGSSSLTGIEAVANAVGLFRDHYKGILRGPVRGVAAVVHNARVVQAGMAIILGSLVAGVCLLAFHAHPLPRVSGSPTVLAQLADLIWGHSLAGRIAFACVQISTLIILALAANTAFNGFPLLASYAAEDRFLPPQLTKRGHRLVFSNGILTLTLSSIAILLFTRGSVARLVALYALGVFTCFTLSGAGMIKYHLRQREKGYRWRIAVNGSAAVLSGLVDIIFLVTKFTEGAWLFVVVVPILVWAFIHFHDVSEKELALLSQNLPAALAAPVPRRHVALVLIERLDLATARAIQYARSLDPEELKAVHIVLDWAEARELERAWSELGRGGLPLELVDCPDRRIGRAVVEVVAQFLADPETEVSVLIPRRVHAGLVRRVLHDRTAERIASLLSNVDRVSATIVPYRLSLPRRRPSQAATEVPRMAAVEQAEELSEIFEVGAAPGVIPIGQVQPRRRARVAGRVVTVTVRPRGGVPLLECVLADRTGRICLVFQGRRQIPGIEPGARILAEGTVAQRGDQLVILNPVYEVLGAAQGAAFQPTGGD
jgi:amino acid transporter